MPKYTQKYTIVCFLETGAVPVAFSALDWPLHVTMLDTFKTDWSVDALSKAIRRVALMTEPFKIRPVRHAMLGPEKDVAVKLLMQDDFLLELHDKLLALSSEGAFVFNTPEFVGKGFLPHVTDQQDAVIEIGETCPIMTISLVDMFPNGDHMMRTVIKTHSLGVDEEYPDETLRQK